ncbi:MAG: serine/threonine protein kinase, partial [Eubacterium sp.]|nr:serine/threonine protein kinase [Eubacterium sp.]
MLKPGTILDDRYEIIDVVGTGGMSTVYRAKDERLKRFVAIKVLKSDYSSDANFVSKFRAEAQSSAGLTHPNIVSVYDVCEDDGRYFIVMELVEGITLKEYISLNGRLSMDQALNFSIQIASGLEAAHEHHVIHRDIKPQNIIVSKSGTIKVTDFGIAKAATSTTMSTTGIGSVHYISPEQARGGYSDERSDIYSLGITMYEMVTGRVPFEGDSNVAIALMHIQNDLIPPRELYPDIYQSFEKIILKATQKKPERRYLTAAALIADLKRVKDNPNIDIIVATSASVSNAPTHQFTPEDMAKIKNGTAQKRNDELEQALAAAGKSNISSSAAAPDRGKIEALLNQNDDYLEELDDDEDDYEEQPRKKQGSLKKVSDKEDYKPSPKKYDDDD